MAVQRLPSLSRQPHCSTSVVNQNPKPQSPPGQRRVGWQRPPATSAHGLILRPAGPALAASRTAASPAPAARAAPRETRAGAQRAHRRRMMRRPTNNGISDESPQRGVCTRCQARFTVIARQRLADGAQQHRSLPGGESAGVLHEHGAAGLSIKWGKPQPMCLIQYCEALLAAPPGRRTAARPACLHASMGRPVHSGHSLQLRVSKAVPLHCRDCPERTRSLYYNLIHLPTCAAQNAHTSTLQSCIETCHALRGRAEVRCHRQRTAGVQRLFGVLSKHEQRSRSARLGSLLPGGNVCCAAWTFRSSMRCTSPFSDSKSTPTICHD